MGDGIRDGLDDIARSADIVIPESLWFATKDEEETAIVRDALTTYAAAKEAAGGSSGNYAVARKARQLRSRAANVISGKARA